MRGKSCQLSAYAIFLSGMIPDIFAKIIPLKRNRVKGRPQDNPVIVHISSMEMLDGLVAEIPREASLLAERFWPGPLTIILKKTALIPDEVSAGLDTVKSFPPIRVFGTIGFIFSMLLVDYTGFQDSYNQSSQTRLLRERYHVP